MEIIEFLVGGQSCGVDVGQVREIIRIPGGVVPVPVPHPSLSGVVNLRGKIIPVIDLSRHFHVSSDGEPRKNRVIVCEFRRFRVGFHVHDVSKIHSISRLIVEAPAQPPEPWGDYLKGIVQIDNRRIALLDFEKIALDIQPAAPERTRPPAQASFSIPDVDFDRSSKKIILVEDSAFMRQLVTRYLKQAGYNVLALSHGLEAWDILQDTVGAPGFKDIAQHYHLILTDVEMPRMDGLELVRKIKGDPLLKKLPCIVLSGSLIEDLPEKCRTAGADAQIAKDDIEHLIRLLDSKVLLS